MLKMYSKMVKNKDMQGLFWEFEKEQNKDKKKILPFGTGIQKIWIFVEGEEVKISWLYTCLKLNYISAIFRTKI